VSLYLSLSRSTYLFYRVEEITTLSVGSVSYSRALCSLQCCPLSSRDSVGDPADDPAGDAARQVSDAPQRGRTHFDVLKDVH